MRSTTPTVTVDVAATSVLVVVEEDVLRQRILLALRRASSSFSSSVAGGPEHDVLVISADGAESLEEKLSASSAGSSASIVVVVPDSCRPRPLITGSRVQGIVLESAIDVALAVTIAAARAGQIVRPSGWDESNAPFLSPREKQVLALVVMGMSNVEIAKKLGIVETTVKSHISASYRKLDVRSRSEACARILDPQTGLGVGILALSAGPYDDAEAQ
jgi:DNA-binding NarL/FixJ family response regulator